MKLNKLFIALVAGIFTFAACEKEGATSLDVIQLDKTYLSIPAAGGDAVLTVNAKEAWHFAKDVVIGKDDDKKDITSELPTWLTASTLSGGEGETKVTFHADAIDGGREQELHILVGESEMQQYLIVRQGVLDPVEATCAEVIAGADGKTYTVSGIVTDIYNTVYGNWWLVDDTGKICIYGTLDKDGKDKNFGSLGIENGDKITVQGPKTTYGETVELVNVTVIKLEKSMIKLDTEEVSIDKEGGEFTVKAAYKGNGVFVNPEEDWIVLKGMEYIAGIATKLNPNPADTAIVTFKVMPNADAARNCGVNLASGTSKATVSVTQTGTDMSVTEILGCTKGDAVTSKPSIVSAKTAKGFVITDGAKAIYVYDNGANGDVKVGDEVIVKGSFTLYNGVPEIEKVSAVTTTETGKTVTYPLAKDVTAYATEYTASEAEFITFSGKLAISGNYYNVNIEGINSSVKQGSLVYPLDMADYNGKNIVVTGYFNGLSGSGGKYLNVIVVSVREYTPGTKGTLSNPYGAAELSALLAGGTQISECVYVTGKVSKIQTAFTAQYGNGTFWISDDGTYDDADPTKNFEAYQVYWLGARWWAEGDPQVAVGDDVVLYGNVTYYAKNKVAETSGKKAYLHSLNGVLK